MADRFFGKILKLNRTVMPRRSASLPRSRRRGPARAGWAAAWLGMAAAGALGAPPSASVYRRPTPPVVATPAGATEAEVQAERIVTSSLLALDQADPFVAKIRQKMQIGNRVLTGPGLYVQAGVADAQRFRFESRLDCQTESFELVEVCDGLFSWRYSRDAINPPSLARVDVRRVRDRLEALKVPQPESAARYLGGLQRTLWSIREWFHFTNADVVELDGRPMWRVEGHWDAQRLAVILPELAEAARRPGGIEPAELPDGVPWSVRLWIDRGDLLPRRIEWLAIPGPRPVTAAAPEPIAVLELHDIEVGGRVEPGTFFYQPAPELMDVTEQTLKTLYPWRP